MGRSKIGMKMIEDETHREVTLSKRRAELLKKAHEVSVLCDVEIGLILFSRTGEFFDYCTHHQSMEQIIEKYQLAKGITQTHGQQGQDLQNMSGMLRTENQLLELSLNNLHGSDDQLNSRKYDELEELEQQLQFSINKVRARKEQLLKLEMGNLERNVEKMEVENNQLWQWIEEQQASTRQQQVTNIDSNVFEQRQQEVLNQFPFLGEEQPASLLQLVNQNPYRPYLLQPMQSDPQEANFHHNQ
ncbi:Transcription factor, MADS-box [Corchorus capsularis]|uniref:Transcription factor, MADS-box n=1 Tax=Corchorus capsularis TaxID=210143 RepID=A0A1R3IB74_COCAP|nr:Transcription factor, MADS-box [Corchorus capsularis]